MVTFKAILEQYNNNGEKTGWTYILLPAAIAEKLQPGSRKGFRVKGSLDAHPINGVAVLPVGGGDFIIPVNATMRKGIKKLKGATVVVSLQVDQADIVPSPAFQLCLEEDELALQQFNALSKSHRNYFIKWVDGVKSEEAVAKRIAQALDALSKGMDFVGMMQYHKQQKQHR
jgi:hypothetical protein